MLHYGSDSSWLLGSLLKALKWKSYLRLLVHKENSVTKKKKKKEMVAPSTYLFTSYVKGALLISFHPRAVKCVPARKHGWKGEVRPRELGSAGAHLNWHLTIRAKLTEADWHHARICTVYDNASLPCIYLLALNRLIETKGAWWFSAWSSQPALKRGRKQ